MRVVVTLLMMATAGVPPGLCSCRLEAMLFPAHDDCSEDGEHDDDCERVLQDAVTPATLPFAFQFEHNGVAPSLADNFRGTSKPAFIAHQTVHWPSTAPIYLIVRALLI